MEEIKFKVWCKNKNEWETDEILLTKSGNLLHIDKEGFETVVSPETHIVVFYTGKKDRNGKEIYGKDIVKDDFDKNKTIEWDKEKATFIEKECGGDNEIWKWCKDYEIIGNAFENPELSEK